MGIVGNWHYNLFHSVMCERKLYSLAGKVSYKEYLLKNASGANEYGLKIL